MLTLRPREAHKIRQSEKVQANYSKDGSISAYLLTPTFQLTMPPTAVRFTCLYVVQAASQFAVSVPPRVSTPGRAAESLPVNRVTTGPPAAVARLMIADEPLLYQLRRNMPRTPSLGQNDCSDAFTCCVITAKFVCTVEPDS